MQQLSLQIFPLLQTFLLGVLDCKPGYRAKLHSSFGYHMLANVHACKLMLITCLQRLTVCK